MPVARTVETGAREGGFLFLVLKLKRHTPFVNHTTFIVAFQRADT